MAAASIVSIAGSGLPALSILATPRLTLIISITTHMALVPVGPRVSMGRLARSTAALVRARPRASPTQTCNRTIPTRNRPLQTRVEATRKVMTLKTRPKTSNTLLTPQLTVKTWKRNRAIPRKKLTLHCKMTSVARAAQRLTKPSLSKSPRTQSSSAFRRANKTPVKPKIRSNKGSLKTHSYRSYWTKSGSTTASIC